MNDRRTEIARRLRREQMDAERLLWSRLRGRQLDGFKFRRQVPIDRYVADFACIEAKLIVSWMAANIRNVLNMTPIGPWCWNRRDFSCSASGIPRFIWKSKAFWKKF